MKSKKRPDIVASQWLYLMIIFIFIILIISFSFFPPWDDQYIANIGQYRNVLANVSIEFIIFFFCQSNTFMSLYCPLLTKNHHWTGIALPISGIELTIQFLFFTPLFSCTVLSLCWFYITKPWDWTHNSFFFFFFWSPSPLYGAAPPSPPSGITMIVSREWDKFSSCDLCLHLSDPVNSDLWERHKIKKNAIKTVYFLTIK